MKKWLHFPPEIAAVGFDVGWVNEKLWALDLPVEDMPVENLMWMFDHPFWSHDDKHFVVTPKEVLANLDRYPRHRELITQAEMRLPLHVTFHKGRWIILDGMHRFAKAVLRGDRKVKVYKVPPELIPFVKDK